MLLLAGFIWNNNFGQNEELRESKFTEFSSRIQWMETWKYNGKLQVKVASHTRWNPCLPGARPVIFTFTVVGPAQYCQSSLKLEAYVMLQTPHYQSPRHACNSRRCEKCQICCKDGFTWTLYTKEHATFITIHHNPQWVSSNHCVATREGVIWYLVLYDMSWRLL